jgi:hypothetical protein
MMVPGWWEPPTGMETHLVPIQSFLMTPPAQAAVPSSKDLPVEVLHRSQVSRNGMIAVVSPENRTQPCALHLDRLVATDFHFLTQRLEFGDLPLCHRAPEHTETPVLGPPTDVREAEEGEGLGFPLPSLPTTFSGIPTELDQPRLFAVEFQGEFSQPFLESGEEPHGVFLKLEARHEVVRKAGASKRGPSRRVISLGGFETQSGMARD